MIKYILATMLLATPAYATYYTDEVPSQPEPQPEAPSTPETQAPSETRSVESWSEPNNNQCDRHNAVPCKANGAGNGVLFQDKSPKRSKGIRP